jgi:phosphoribosylanthranilate isomerase
MRTYRTRIKICGITNAEDARAAIKAGADALGVVLNEGPRQMSLGEAAEALRDIPPFVARVGVFVDSEPDFVEEATRCLRLSALQFHGDESPERCAEAPAPVIKAVQVRDGFDPNAAFSPYRSVVAAFLLDTFVRGESGGTGVSWAWEQIPDLPKWAPIIVAGGLTPVNVGAAVRSLMPYGVDVSSGVEERRRHKDHLKLQAFVAAVRSADEEVRR